LGGPFAPFDNAIGGEAFRSTNAIGQTTREPAPMGKYLDNFGGDDSNILGGLGGYPKAANGNELKKAGRSHVEKPVNEAERFRAQSSVILTICIIMLN